MDDYRLERDADDAMEACRNAYDAADVIQELVNLVDDLENENSSLKEQVEESFEKCEKLQNELTTTKTHLEESRKENLELWTLVHKLQSGVDIS